MDGWMDIITLAVIGVRANFFLVGGWAIFARKIFDSARKKCYANLQNYFARLTPSSNY